LSGGLLLQRHLTGGESRKDTTMINKISAVLTAVLILGSASVAAAATSHKRARHHGYVPRGQLMLLENVPARLADADMKAAINFQSNWNVSY
jgi:hypothetical protein